MTARRVHNYQRTQGSGTNASLSSEPDAAGFNFLEGICEIQICYGENASWNTDKVHEIKLQYSIVVFNIIDCFPLSIIHPSTYILSSFFCIFIQSSGTDNSWNILLL